MAFKLECCEWVNMNRSAQKLKEAKTISIAGSDTTYILQVAGGFSQTHLACLTSDQLIHVYDQNSLKLKHTITNSHSKNINEIGLYKQEPSMLFSCGDDGYLKCWDVREGGCSGTNVPALCVDYFKGARELLCADINFEDAILMTATNRSIDDALVCLFDVRFADKYMYKFCESHSKDITQVKFNPHRARKFCSGSLDGLVCLYDLDMEQEENARRTDKAG